MFDLNFLFIALIDLNFPIFLYHFLIFIFLKIIPWRRFCPADLFCSAASWRCNFWTCCSRSASLAFCSAVGVVPLASSLLLAAGVFFGVAGGASFSLTTRVVLESFAEG
jgi:hypothetical protein